MINELRIENVRAFEGNWKFHLSPLTILCGTNSAGKSSLIKTILLIRQSQEQRRKIARLRFVGNFVDMGDYASVVSYGDTKHDIGIGFSVDDVVEYGFFAEYFGLEIPEGKSREDEVVFTLKVDFTFKRIPTSSQIYQDVHTENSEEEMIPSGYLHHSGFSIMVHDREIFAWEIGYRASANQDGEPELPNHELLIKRDFFRLIRLPRDLQEQISKRKKIISLPVLLDGFFPIAFFVVSEEKRDQNAPVRQRRINLVPIDIIPQISQTSRSITRVLETLTHIAPLRALAKRYYVLRDAEVRIDSTGNFVPRVLRESKRLKIRDYPLDSQSPTNECTLDKALNSWLYFLRTGNRTLPERSPSEIQISTGKDPLIELSLRSPSGQSLHPLLDSGMGLSQVLPVLILALRARKGEVVLIEQPELHLNPALQVRLAEFFVHMAKAGKQLILETHSEHIVNTIRVLAAEDETGEIAAMSKIYFVDAGQVHPKIHDLSIQPDGTVPDWPPNFFGEALALTGRLLRAQKRFRSER